MFVVVVVAKVIRRLLSKTTSLHMFVQNSLCQGKSCGGVEISYSERRRPIQRDLGKGMRSRVIHGAQDLP